MIPCFFLHHANVDRMFSIWQYLGHMDLFSVYYSSWGEIQPQISGNREDDKIWPWDGGFAHPESDQYREQIANRVVGGAYTRTNGSVLDYRNMRISYDIFGGKLTLAAPINSTISKCTSVLFTFEVLPEQSNRTFTFGTTGTTDLEMELYGPALCDNCFGHWRAYDDNSGSGGINPRISITLESGLYYIIVRPYVPTADLNKVPFTISVKLSIVDIAELTKKLNFLNLAVGKPAPSKPVSAKGHELYLGKSYTASIAGHGQSDWYYFIVPEGLSAPIVVETSGQVNGFLILYGANPPKGILAWAYSSDNNKLVTIKKELAPGLYHISAGTFAGQVGPYTITVW